MNLGDIVIGQRQSWTLIKRLGEGDAGEVFQVESLLERKTAILKRPYHNAFSSDLLRQASQINHEGKILKALETVQVTSHGTRLVIPSLLDHSLPGTETSGNAFIILEKADGFDLTSLARISRFGKTALLENSPLGREYQIFIEHLVKTNKLPELILLRAIDGVIALIEAIHNIEVNADGSKHYGIIWNDIKPDHIYWDPLQTRLTLIDWGNAQFLDADGGAKDRHASRNDDHLQLVNEFGRFLSEANPSLFNRLVWSEVSTITSYEETVLLLKDRISSLLADALEDLRTVRRQESDRVGALKPGLAHLKKLATVQARIMGLGEIPDFKKAIGLHARLAEKLAQEQTVGEFRIVCKEAASLPSSGETKWELLDYLASLTDEIEKNSLDTPASQAAFFRALEAGVSDDWTTALWELFSSNQGTSLPAWWDDVSQRIRQLQLGLDEETLPPLTVINRLFFALQATVMHLLDKRRQNFLPEREVGSQPPSDEILLRVLEEEVLKKWVSQEPDPPNAGIEYIDLDRLCEDIDTLLPGAFQAIENTLIQPKAQAKIVMEAWSRKEFNMARRGLRQILLWDPHRRRLLLAEHAIQAAPKWLIRVRQGASPDEAFQDYLLQVELAGRELRHQVGPAAWLDLILDTLMKLRNGSRPADLIMEHPELLNEIPWLSEYRSRDSLTLPGVISSSLERDPTTPSFDHNLRGVREGILGPKRDMALSDPLDTWTAEARGSSARVFNGVLPMGGPRQPLAIKILRPDQVDYALPLFKEEVQILTLMRDVPGVVHLIECGFIRLQDGQALPAEDRHHPANDLRGQLLRFGTDEVQNFIASMESHASQGWLPYLALEKKDHTNNLMVYCDAGHTRGRFLPLGDGLLLALQICDILQIAHDRNITYRDHKILHFYWDSAARGVSVIDWNIARRYPQGLTHAERRFDVVQFGARALHHILTGRTAHGALPLGPNRPQEIETAARTYHTQWTYDDDRLPQRVKEIVEQTLGEGFTYVKDLRQDLYQVFQQVTNTVTENGN